MPNATQIPTLQDVLAAIAARESGTRKRDLKSAVTTFCRAVGQPPQAVLAQPPEIRRLREGVSPMAMGVDPRRWANVCSGVAKAIGLVRPCLPSRNTAPLAPEWKVLLDGLPTKLARKLSAGMRYLSSNGALPEAVTEEDLTGYCQAIVHDRMRRNAEQAADAFIWAWNRTAAQYPVWPQIMITRADKRNTYTFPLEVFPITFQQDVEAYARRLREGVLFAVGEEDEDDEIDLGPLRPMRPATVTTRLGQLRTAASCLVHAGIDRAEITSIAKLVELRNAKHILNYMMQRNPDAQTSGGVEQMASLLAKIALHWVKVDPGDHRQLKRLADRVRVQRSGMTGKNRDRLRPFDDEDMVAEFVCLPDTIRRQVERDRRAPARKAIDAQLAAAIAILIVIPLRVANLAAIDLNRHLVANRNGVYLVIPEAETKNRQPINFQIPGFALETVKWYIREYRELLVRGDSTALFPGATGGSKSPHTLALQIKQIVWRFLGLQFNVHLFRHAAGKIFLDIHPGNYEVVRQLLGHRSITTTTGAYSGAETRQAGLLYARLIEGLQAAHRPTPRKRRLA